MAAFAPAGLLTHASQDRSDAERLELGCVPKSVLEAQLIRMLVQWLATPLAMLALRAAEVPERMFWLLTSGLLAWLFWTVLSNSALACPYCRQGVLVPPRVDDAARGFVVGVPESCPSCTADLTAPYDPASRALAASYLTALVAEGIEARPRALLKPSP